MNTEPVAKMTHIIICAHYIKLLTSLSFCLKETRDKSLPPEITLTKIIKTLKTDFDANDIHDFISLFDQISDGLFSNIRNKLRIRGDKKTQCLFLFLMGMDYKMIASITDISIDNLYSMKSKILSQLKVVSSPIKEYALLLLDTDS